MTLKIYIGNKVYSSWSLRGWLALRQSGLAHEEEVVSLYGDAWEKRRTAPEFAASNGKVPVLWDGDSAVWESLAIIDHLADKVGRDRFWPKPDDDRAMARSMVAEMHSSYAALRHECTMNIRARADGYMPSEAVAADIIRILQLWAEARARFGKGGPFLFGAFCVADIFYAPVVSRFLTYGIPVPGFAVAYMQAVWEHPWMAEWIAAAESEDWVIEQYEQPVRA